VGGDILSTFFTLSFGIFVFPRHSSALFCSSFKIIRNEQRISPAFGYFNLKVRRAGGDKEIIPYGRGNQPDRFIEMYFWNGNKTKIDLFSNSQMTENQNLSLEGLLRNILPRESPSYFYANLVYGIIFKDIFVATAELFADLGILPNYLRPQNWPQYSTSGLKPESPLPKEYFI